MSEHMQDKVIIVTGAASGFGRLISQKAAALGARLVCADLPGTTLADTVESIVAAGGSAIAGEADVTRLDQMEQLRDRALERFGVIDVMVNNAGVMPLAFFADHAAARDAWHRCIDVNIKGVLNGIIAVHDTMIAQGRGQVINLSSIYGNFPVAGAGVYGASKAAVDFLSASLRVESQGRIKVTNVKPTGVPGTALAGGVINPAAVVGIVGHQAGTYGAQMEAWAAGQLPAAETDPEHISYRVLDPELLADQVIHVIDQPWGVSISEITVRASGDAYLL
ncbi:MAG: SDR family NAD(P)-dependent oxidoreductase [Pseudomonadales bacterium]|jgi:NADP-dependent 3-hydroxy acid dehydrogenase YdfG|nr:SDR family NAD(P)-dependent oxidoreductase [Pseudomonadales bacterium]